MGLKFSVVTLDALADESLFGSTETTLALAISLDSVGAGTSCRVRASGRVGGNGHHFFLFWFVANDFRIVAVSEVLLIIEKLIRFLEARGDKARDDSTTD